MRIRIFTLILVFCLAFLLVGLFSFQVLRHDNYRVMSEENRLKVTPLMAPRGNIYDRNGKYLVKNKLSFNLCAVYNQIKDIDALSGVLSLVLDTDQDKIKENITRGKRNPYTPFCIASDIGVEKAIYLEEISNDYPGLFVDVSAKREYVNGGSASAVIGYLGLINQPEFERLKHYGYRIDDLVGRDGVEKYYDNYLRGVHGGKQVEVDHLSRELRVLGYKEPIPGKDIYLTLDAELQEYCDQLLEGKKGAIIVMDSNTGAILALASAPVYDPGVFIDRKRSEELKHILGDEDYPLINRAISGAYPPGSVFKVVIASAGLELKKIDLESSFNCDGTLVLGRKVFRCWYEKGHGVQTIKEALKNSCNVFFYRLGLLLGVDNIAGFSSKFNLGDPTGIDLPGEKGGVLPSRKWKRKNLNDKWYKGETVNYAIGQGYLLCTPLQIARVMAVFANEGILLKPYVVSKVGNIDVRPDGETNIEISRETIEIVRDGLKKVVNDPRGTGMKAKLEDVVVAGKTGTAQTSRGKSHGWFAGFAPFEDSKITVVIFDEYGGKGGYYAAQTAGKVFKKAKSLELI